MKGVLHTYTIIIKHTFLFKTLELHILLFLDKPCHVCNTGNVGGAHNCGECGSNVHVFCGTPVCGSEEGYSQPVTCFKCKPSKSKQDIYLYM